MTQDDGDIEVPEVLAVLDHLENLFFIPSSVPLSRDPEINNNIYRFFHNY